jgi:hypothetical protein
MTDLTAHLGALADNLNEVRRRLRNAARVEVARAVGEALRDFALTLICGPTRYGIPRYFERSRWHDPWGEDNRDAWASDDSFEEADESAERIAPTGTPSIHAALVLSLGAARWGYLRTRQVIIAIAIGAAVAITVFAGGPTVEAFLAAWGPAQDLLSSHGHTLPP